MPALLKRGKTVLMLASAGKLQRMEQERRSFIDELSELKPRLEASEARVEALQEELKRSHTQAAAAAASADQRIQASSCGGCCTAK